MTNSRYMASSIEAEVKITAREVYNSEKERGMNFGPRVRREVTLNLREDFTTDEGLDHAINSFAATIKEAVRR